MSQLKKNKKLELASWNLPDVVLSYYKRQGVELMFPWQVQCLQTGKALQGGNLLYSAPTSAGKTLVAEILALKCILKTKRKAIFILPFVSVAREKMFTLRAMYSGLGLTVGGFMGAQTPPGGFKRVDIAVCTIERANSLINRLLESDKLSQLAVIVVDELHMVGDPSRGCLIEPLLTKVNFHVAKATGPDEEVATSVQIIGMSATLPNMHVLSKWLQADLYCTDFRPVPLTEYVKVGSSVLDTELRHIRDIQVPGMYDNDSEMIVNLCLETIKQGKSVLIFCPAKEWCERLCTTIAKAFYLIMAGKAQTSSVLREPVTESINKEKILDLLEQMRRCPAGLAEQLRTSISYGVAFHHAGLTLEEKDIIESGFRKSVIRILVATTTLSSGVNLPAQRVIIRSPLFMGKSMDALTYKQMVGRAGRKGIDTFGESVLICKPSEKALVKELLNSDLPAATSQMIRRDADGGYTLKGGVRRALLEMIASGTAKTVETMNKYMNCTLLAAELESNAVSSKQLVRDCLNLLEKDEFINITSVEDEVELLTPTQLGSAVFASSMNPDDSLTILCDLNKARKQFVLENELHMVYQVTPINALHDNIDWVRYLNLWESLSVDEQRVGELVGVSERFITLSHQGRRRRHNDRQRRSLQIHRRFYTSLVLHDLVNETPLTVIEKKYGVNKGAVQALQQNAAIFAGMICTFCSKLGWTPLKLLLSDFQQRLNIGVRRELVDLVRISSLDAKKARHLYNSGLHTVSDVVNSSVDQISLLLNTFLPFESTKQGFGETEWELKDRTARRLFIRGSSQLVSLKEAAQLILEEAQVVLQEDLNMLGVHNQGVNHSLMASNSSAASSRDTEATSSRDTEATSSGDTEAIARGNLSSNHLNSFSCDHSSQMEEIQPNSLIKRLSFRQLKKSSSPIGEVLLADSQEVGDKSPSGGVNKYTKLLDSFEKCSSVSTGSDKCSSVLTGGDKCNSALTGVDKCNSALTGVDKCNSALTGGDKCNNALTGVDKCNSALTGGDKCNSALTGVDKCNSALTGGTHMTLAKDELSTADVQPSSADTSSSILWEDSFMFPSQGSGTGPSPEREASHDVHNSQRLLNDIPGGGQISKSDGLSRRRQLSPDLTYTRLKVAKRIRTSTVDRTRSASQSSQQSTPRARTPGCSSVSCDQKSADSCLVTPIQQVEKYNSFSTWSLNETFHTEGLLAKADSTSCMTASDSNDLFSKSMESLMWSPMSEAGHATPTASPMSAQLKSKSTPAAANNQPEGSRQHQVPSSPSPGSMTISPSSKALVLDSPSKLRSASKIDIVDVSADRVLFNTFLSDWSEASQYSLSLACGSLTELSIQQPESIGYHSSGSRSSAEESCGHLSTSTVLSAKGMVLHQYKVVVVGLAVTIKSVVFYLDLTSDVEFKLKAVSRVVLLSHSTKVMFDCKEHLKRLSSLLDITADLGTVIDPKVIVWMLDPAEKEHNLIGVIHKAAPWLNAAVTANIGACIGNGSIGLTPHTTASPRLRACYESLAMMAVVKPLLTMLEERGLSEAFTNIEMPHLACLARMEIDGLGMDVGEFSTQTEKIKHCLHLIEKRAHGYSRKAFDLNSPKEIGEVLFVELRLPYDRKKVISKRGAPWSTAQAQLEKIKSLHPLPGLMMLWRKLHLMSRTLLHPLDESKVWCEKRTMYRIYSTCSIHTATGRVSMHEPNLQTVNKDISVQLQGTSAEAEETVSLRNAFCAAPGYTLLSADYSQLELRIISHLASDSTLLSLLNGGGDVFKDIASRWKSVSVSEVSSEQRQSAKQICYGIIYGMGSRALAEQLSVDEATADQLMTDFQRTFTGLKKYIVSTTELCRETGYVSTIAGRKRYLPNINSCTNRAGKSQAERQAVNTTVQGSAADLVKLATINLSRALHPDDRLVLQIHDELLYEVQTSRLLETARLVKQKMESVGDELNLQVNMVVRIKAGPTWAQLQELSID